MGENTVGWTLGEYIAFLNRCSIDQAYRELAYDYAAEAEFQKHGSCAEERARFLARFQWRHEAHAADIKRIFNQTNTFYAENWAASNALISPLECISRVIQLILFRQGRNTGVRNNHIAYGARVDLDTFDPRRHFNLLRGIAPSFLETAMQSWVEGVRHASQKGEAALYLAMALIAIHPFADGNGRLARIVYTWLLRRWSLPVRWFAEAGDGEFFRIGFGIDSTEYLMGQFVLELCGGYNRVKHGFGEEHSTIEDTEALTALQKHLVTLTQEAAFAAPTFTFLANHMRQNHHFRTTSPRFECLKVILRS